ncbi:MAG: carbohydrate ABC transporter permease, partial [Bradyrhizobium sp.]|nr:carbohydrate ABC transporter permease [Bradyrhizobium sp.]
MTVTQQNPHLSVVAAVADPRQERLLRSASRFDRLPQDAPTPASEQKFSGFVSKPIKQIAGRIGLYAAVIVICIYSFFPIYWMIVSSLRAPQRLFLDTSLAFWPPDLSSYKSLLELTN